MAVVRCPRHNIPYNDRNPRGCPACFAEGQGESADAAIMRQLARASRAMPQPADPGPATSDRDRASWPPPVTAPPRLPTRALGVPEQAWRWIAARHAALGGAAAVAVALFLLWVILRQDFVEVFEPPVPAGAPLPVPVEIHMPIEGVFARLGAQPPALNPDSPDLARYQFGSAAVDALNGTVYAVTITASDRTWKGVRTGVDEETARGMLALLGGARERAGSAPRAPVTVGGYQVYTTSDDRPRRTLIAEVRPPNGCYDVQVTIAPRSIGRLAQGDGSVVVVAHRGQPITWAVDRLRVVSRALAGPYAGSPACAVTALIP